MAANIGLEPQMVKASKTVLNNLLADHFVLLAKPGITTGMSKA